MQRRSDPRIFKRGPRDCGDASPGSAPRVVCFHGITGYRAFARYALDSDRSDWTLGAQPLGMGIVRLYVIPNPSPANAHFRLDDLIRWYDRLASFLDAPRSTAARR